jgi:hypothetical protein
MKPKGCGPRNLGSPFKQTKTNKKTIQNIQGPSKEDTFTPTYNAATGFTIDQDPTYDYNKRESYKKNAISKYGSLSKARAAYKSPNRKNRY